MPPHLADEKGFRTIPASTFEVVAAMSPDELRADLLGLLEISKAFLTRQDLAALLDQYLKSLRTALRVDSASVLLFSPDRTSLEVKAADGITPDAEGASTPIEPGSGILAKVAAAREAIIIDDVADIEEPGPGLAGLASSMVAPLIVEGDLIGLTRVGAAAQRRFSDFDLLLLRASSEHLALAIRNWQLHEAADEQTSDRERIVEALAEAESRQKILAETAADAIVSINADSTIVTANPAAADIFGYPLEELVNKPFTDLIPSRFREAHLAGIDRYLKTGKKRLSWRAMELPGLHRSGREIPFEVSFAEGVVQGERLFTGTLRDISERKRAERVLAAQYATTRVLAESPSVQDAMPKILASLGPALGWDAGGFWTWDDGIGALTGAHFWTSPSIDGADFTSVSENTVFEPGIGLPGRVWQSRKPVGSSRVDLQACKLEYSIVSPK